MDNSILYSIVIPIYGVEKFLEKCIESVIFQTYKNIEIILVNDGSKDKCPVICNYYKNKDSRIKVLHKKNGGLVSARKSGVELASGKYVFCVDGDDWVSLNYVEEFHKIIKKYSPDMIACGYIYSNEKKQKKNMINFSEGNYINEELKEKILPFAIEGEDGTIFPPQLWAKAFKKEIYLPEQLSVDNLIKIGEDGAVVKPILTKCNSVYILNKCLYYYRINDFSMTNNKSSYDWNGPRYIQKHLMERININKENYKEQIYRRTSRDIYTVVFSRFNQEKPYKEIKKEIIKNLSCKDYENILKNCRYCCLKYKIETMLLRRKIIFPIFLLHKIYSIRK
ncbi:MAG: glycosyltransferase family 2 protein [Fusobacterium sp.]|uniref:glycosyltransferase family 2 protein n=1 Tax=Fusobacterium sp. TaxID=68766 RepID=UPI002A7607BB|nr:glycosyltransferase family 2 protein [Fusobacterium sp.]MDY2980503.1 glycosyltransferase family 2 protein [Fusobacterium sp.]